MQDGRLPPSSNSVQVWFADGPWDVPCAWALQTAGRLLFSILQWVGAGWWHVQVAQRVRIGSGWLVLIAWLFSGC